MESKKHYWPPEKKHTEPAPNATSEEVLGVEHDTPEHEVHQAFRKGGLKHHPDQNNNDDTAWHTFHAAYRDIKERRGFGKRNYAEELARRLVTDEAEAAELERRGHADDARRVRERLAVFKAWVEGGATGTNPEDTGTGVAQDAQPGTRRTHTDEEGAAFGQYTPDWLKRESGQYQFGASTNGQADGMRRGSTPFFETAGFTSVPTREAVPMGRTVEGANIRPEIIITPDGKFRLERRPVGEKSGKEQVTGMRSEDYDYIQSRGESFVAYKDGKSVLLSPENGQPITDPYEYITSVSGVWIAGNKIQREVYGEPRRAEVGEWVIDSATGAVRTERFDEIIPYEKIIIGKVSGKERAIDPKTGEASGFFDSIGVFDALDPKQSLLVGEMGGQFCILNPTDGTRLSILYDTIVRRGKNLLVGTRGGKEFRLDPETGKEMNDVGMDYVGRGRHNQVQGSRDDLRLKNVSLDPKKEKPHDEQRKKKENEKNTDAEKLLAALKKIAEEMEGNAKEKKGRSRDGKHSS